MTITQSPFERLDNTAGSPPAGTASAGAGLPADPLANKEVFLRLLIAQIKNQDPLNPTDGVQFLSQLSQFTSLEQTMGMRQDLQKILGAIEKLGPTRTGA